MSSCTMLLGISTIHVIVGAMIQAKVAFSRINTFLEAPEIQNRITGDTVNIKSADFSWDESSSNPSLKHTNVVVKQGEKNAICGEVGSGKSALLAAILGQVSNVKTIKREND
ncbi:DNA helicase [Ranunculus cassubicifolius]